MKKKYYYGRPFNGFTLTLINNTPTLGTLTKNPDQNVYSYGDSVICIATPISGKSVFSKLIIDGISELTLYNVKTFTMDQNHTCEAVFLENTIVVSGFVDCDGELSNTIDQNKNYLGIYLTDIYGYTIIVALGNIADISANNDDVIKDYGLSAEEMQTPSGNFKSLSLALINNRDGDVLLTNLLANDYSEAAKYCNEYLPSGCSISVNWRMPTCYDLICMAFDINNLNSKIQSLGGILIVKTHDTLSGIERAYWASEYTTEQDESTAHPFKIYFDYGNIDWMGDYRYTFDNNYVRPVASLDTVTFNVKDSITSASICPDVIQINGSTTTKWAYNNDVIILYDTIPSGSFTITIVKNGYTSSTQTVTKTSLQGIVFSMSS